MKSTATAEWLHGPSVARFLHNRGVEHTARDVPSLDRRLRAWRQGGAANVYVVDKLLTHYGFHLSELPENIGVEEPRGMPPRSG